MHDWATWIWNGLPLLLILVIWVLIMTKFKKWSSPYGVLMEKQNELIEQQLTVLREINETLKQLRESRG